MANVSRPLVIALAATVALTALWLVAFRPKPVAIENTPLSSTKVIPQANQASAISNAANAKLQAAAAAADGSAPPPAAVPTGTQQGASPQAAAPGAKAKAASASKTGPAQV